MSLRDRFRSLRRDDDDDAEPAETSTDAEPASFSPRLDGVYDGGPDPDGTDVRIFLRFTAGRVREVSAADAGTARDALLTTQLSGEYTPSGRFSVQGGFSRPVVYTVLAGHDDGWTVRRTNSGTATTHEVRLVFVADA